MTSSARSSIAPESNPEAMRMSRAIAPSVRPAASMTRPSSVSSPCTSTSAAFSASACSLDARWSSVPSMSQSSRSGGVTA